MGRRSTRIDPRLPAWLADWAAWHEGAAEYASGYASSTPQYRAMMAQRVTEHGSAIPRGVEPPRGLARLCLALAATKDDQARARYVTVAQRYYVIQHYHGASTEAADLCAREYKIARPTAYHWKRLGEQAIDRWLREN